MKAFTFLHPFNIGLTFVCLHAAGKELSVESECGHKEKMSPLSAR